MRVWARLFLTTLLGAGLAACATTTLAPVTQVERDAAAARMMRDIEVLASDEFGGRKPGTPGEERTVSYLISRMQAIGLTSGTNDPGSAWRAPVELVSTRPLDHTITVRTASRTSTLPLRASAAYSLGRRVLIDGVEVAFVGDGTRDIEPDQLAGRIVILAQERSDPEVRNRIFAANPAALIAIVPDQDALDKERARFERERLLLASDESDRLSGFVTREAFAKALPRGEWDRLLTNASTPEFRFEVMATTIAIDAKSARRKFTSSNVIGLLPGKVRGSGAVLLMAHWDHLGECAPATPDPICNGAVDNASGLALLLELAARLKAKGPHDRDIYLVATSAEEAGLLGAKAFVKAPPVPLDSIEAAFNFDTVAVAPAGGSFGYVGEGRTRLDPLVRELVSKRGVGLGDREYAQEFLKRHDGWVLMEAGVPAVLISTAFASEIVLGPYLATRYHAPGDEVRDEVRVGGPGGVEVRGLEVRGLEVRGLEMGGAVDDLLLHEELVIRLADVPDAPVSDTSVSQ